MQALLACQNRGGVRAASENAHETYAHLGRCRDRSSVRWLHDRSLLQQPCCRRRRYWSCNRSRCRPSGRFGHSRPGDCCGRSDRRGGRRHHRRSRRRSPLLSWHSRLLLLGRCPWLRALQLSHKVLTVGPRAVAVSSAGSLNCAMCEPVDTLHANVCSRPKADTTLMAEMGGRRTFYWRRGGRAKRGKRSPSPTHYAIILPR